MNDLTIIGRDFSLFTEDVQNLKKELFDIVSKSSFLVIGGAGTIGSATVKEIFNRNPKLLHVIDLSENNLVELVRDLRSSAGYIDGDFKTFAIDVNSIEFQKLCKTYKYDYVLNLSAIKHVRSEKDLFTLMRLIKTNIFYPKNAYDFCVTHSGTKKYFCVSTDKASDPVNFMGASKRIMELMLLSDSSNDSPVSLARFANVAFSDGSLLKGFENRIDNHQPIAAPHDIRRYFMTKKESGELCLLSALLGNDAEIFFPKLVEKFNLIDFKTIAIRFLESKGLQPFEATSEQEAREYFSGNDLNGKWPCYFFETDTTGEKDIEEFFTPNEKLDSDRFNSIGIITNALPDDFALSKLEKFKDGFLELEKSSDFRKSDLFELFNNIITNFLHVEKNKNLDEKM